VWPYDRDAITGVQDNMNVFSVGVLNECSMAVSFQNNTATTQCRSFSPPGHPFCRSLQFIYKSIMFTKHDLLTLKRNELR